MFYPVSCTDPCGRSFVIEKLPRRVVSLVPSQTEFLIEAGLQERLVGITKYCIHPRREIKGIQKVGGTKDADVAKILSLKPDLIVANKEENTPELIGALEKSVPCWVSDISCLDDALMMMQTLGEILDLEASSKLIARNIQQGFEKLLEFSQPQQGFRVLYLIWREPYMAAGSDTFINDMLWQLGCQNVISEKRYPVLNQEDINTLRPDLIFLSSEPYHFQAAHQQELQSLAPWAQVVLVDGELFSWYGSRLEKSVAYFTELRKTVLKPHP
ncbi:MAG: cobalamin-binding protein [Cytophagales bacterium]|nr:MAG: cobalamin-binding protein [Cytophagales bacterium]TAF60277.1 MAG: cobalamin-binding protein [Cytophagales bacterium]